MGERKRYRKQATALVTAVKLDLDMDGFTYRKWGGDQTCKAGDWLLNNDGDTYSVAGDVFERTYEKVSDGVYKKVSTIWAEIADKNGKIKTKEGETHYSAGDYIVFNEGDEQDGYAIEASKFVAMYEAVE